MTSRRIVFKPQWPIPVSGEAIRNVWLGHYRAIEKKLFKLKREWNLFETEAQVEYQGWYHGVFATELSVLKELEDTCRELTLILSAVEAQIQINHLTRRSAFEYVMEAVKQKRDPFPSEEEQNREREEKRRIFQEQFKASLGRQAQDEEIDPLLLERARERVAQWAQRKFQDPPRSNAEAHHRNRVVTEALHDVYDDLKNKKATDEFNQTFGGNREDSSGSEDEAYTEREATSDDVKTLYRKIVRALHPDRGQEMTPGERDLWGQTQTAYQAQDKDALKLILMRIEGSGGLRVQELSSISEIMELTKALQNEWEEINLHRSRVKKDPVYRFWASRTKPKSRKVLEEDIDKGLRQQIFYLKGALRELNSEMGQFQRKSKR
jgi:hypothetical protein